MNKLTGDKNLGEILEGGKRKGPWPSLEGESSTLMLIGQSLVTG